MRMLAGAVVILAGAILCGITVYAQVLLAISKSQYSGGTYLAELFGMAIVGFGFVIIVGPPVIDALARRRSTQPEPFAETQNSTAESPD
jgi:hypothetical protein